MSGYLFASHDRFGLSAVRRNAKIASALRAIDPRAPIALVTGVTGRFGWLDRDDMEVIRVAPITTSPVGRSKLPGASVEHAVAERSRAFVEAVDRLDPDVVVVDRHPFGIFGELREGLERARERGARIVLGLRDILDDPATVAEELGGVHWAGAVDTYHEVLVYGERHVCDHEMEYGLPIRPLYTGWIVDPAKRGRREPRLLAIAAGGGSDGEAVCRLGLEVLSLKPRWSAVFAAGPSGGEEVLVPHGPPTAGRRAITATADGCARLFARSSGVLVEASYNATCEALGAGLRPIFPPRVPPRREEAIRASRLAALGLADAVPDGAIARDVAELLDRPRTLPADALRRAGIGLDGAPRAASHLRGLASHRTSVRARPGAPSTRASSRTSFPGGARLAFVGSAALNAR